MLRCYWSRLVCCCSEISHTMFSSVHSHVGSHISWPALGTVELVAYYCHSTYPKCTLALQQSPQVHCNQIPYSFSWIQGNLVRTARRDWSGQAFPQKTRSSTRSVIRDLDDIVSNGSPLQKKTHRGRKWPLDMVYYTPTPNEVSVPQAKCSRRTKRS